MRVSAQSFVVLVLPNFAQCTKAFKTTDFTVETTNGNIIGHRASNASNVVEFLGIPYAKPPIGNLRFEPPVAWQGNKTFKAETWGFDCPQLSAKPAKFPGFTPQAQRIIDAFAAGNGNAQSEDCLTLNIWTTSLHRRRSSKNRPVLIFFHGGRFAIGNANSPFYNGQRFAGATDAVIVTLTYRLNVFGFPGAPGRTQNLGLRDQRLAVEWIRDNIASFGGDPRRLTVFGQSSGGVAADWWTFAYQTNPILHGIISESGNAFSFPLNKPARQISNWYNVSATLGCGSFGNVVECMQRQDWKAVLAAASKLPAAPGGNPVRSTPPFYPIVDGETVFSDYSTRLRDGQFAKIPQLLGNNNHEQGYYVIPAFARGINVTDAQGEQFLLESFTCPGAVEVRARSALGVPVWQYRYFADWDNIRLYPTSGAYHGTELEMLFGNSGAVSGIPPSGAEEQLSRLMQRAWVAFADNPWDGLSRFGWREFDPAEKSLIRLGYEGSPEPDFVDPSIYGASCSNVTLGASG